MPEVRKRLQAHNAMGRKNLSVPNPGVAKSLDQEFVRDPDGYYLEFADSEGKVNSLVEVCCFTCGSISSRRI